MWGKQGEKIDDDDDDTEGPKGGGGGGRIGGTGTAVLLPIATHSLSRQEDGNEAQLFGLLIRPSATTAQTQQSAPPPGVLPIAALTAGPSTIQIVPTSFSSSPSSDNGTKKGLPAQDGRAVFSRCGSALFNTNSTTSNGVASTAAALFASGTSNGMPPILPRPKNGKTMARLSQQQQLMRSLVQLPTKTTSTLAFEMAQSSPQQIVSQLASTAISLENCEALSVSTASSSSSSSSGCSSSSTPSLLCSSVSAFPSQPIASTASSNNTNGLLTIHSPPQKAKPQKAAGEKLATALKTPRRRRSRQTLASEGTAQSEEGNGASSSTARSNSGTETDNAGGGADLLGDLHSIEYSQLVNSSVITTEDYLPSQSDPIYTNMDMYSASSLSAAHLQQQNGQLKSEQRQQKQQTTDAEKNTESPAAIVAPSLCPSAIFIHNQQHHQQPLLGQSHHSSASSSVRFVPSVSAAVPPPSSQQQPHPSHWHPYMGAHPGGPSHISSTPDSGIQSIDGSPPSVYTPPMVSPYASQVRSCESVNNGIHCGMPSSSSAICATVGGILPNPSSCSSAPSFYGTSAYSSLTEESLTITTFNPSSSSSLFLSSSLNVPPSLIIEQFAEGENGDGETANDQSQRRQMLGQQQQGEEEDFSDMPKLVPVTHSEHDEEVVEQQDQFGPGTSATVPAAEDDGKRGTAPPLFHPGMSLHELAECLSSNISREQLKQLTSLIQRKAEEQKNNLEGGGNERREEKRTNEEKEKEEDERRKEEREQQKEEQQQHQRKITEEEREREKKEEEEKGVEERKRGTKRSKTNSEVSSGAKRREEAVGRVEEGEEAGEGKEGKAGDGRGGDDEADRKARDLEQLAIYRSRVRQQLNRKLAALLERVIRRMDKCHLNLSPIGGAAEFSQKGWPWKKMNWEEIHRRAEARGEAWMMPTMAKGRGRKRKSGKEEDEGKEEEVNVGRRAGEKKRVNGERSERDTKRERKVKKRNSEEKHGVEDQTKKRVTRKRRGREEDGEKEKQTKRMHDERGGQEEKREEPKKEEKQEKNIQEERRERNEKREEAGEREEKQNTPPIILRIRPPTAKPTALTTIKRMTAPRAATGKTFDCASATVAKRRKPSSSPKPSCSFSSPAAVVAADNSLRERSHSNAAFSTTDGGRKSAIGGRRWTTTTTGRRTTKGGGGGTTPREGQQQHNGSTPRPRRTRRMRMEMPSQEHILSDRERTIVHSTRCFLIRNLSRRRRIGKGTSTQCQRSNGMELTQVLERLLTHFCAIIDHCFVSDRQLDELIRTVKLMLSSVRDPSALLARFDSLLKQFIASSLPNSIHHNESINSQYAQMKQSIDFGKLKCSVSKEALSAFLDEGLRSLSASSNKRDTFHRPLTVDTSIDLSYLDSPHPVGQWDPDKAAKLSPTSDNRDHDCVRCICGIAEDDGVMSQCDRCHFWLHADCLDCPVLDDQQEFVCDFCTRRIETTPRVDIVLKPQPTLKLSGCNYYRTLVNSRGLQVRLNESVYVERLINDKHKSILRELHEECVRKQQLAHSAQQSPQKRGRGSVGKRKSGGKVAETEQKEGEKDEERTTKTEANRWWPEQTDYDAGDEAENDGSRAKASTSSGMGMTPVDSDGTNLTGNNGTQPFRFHRRDLRVFRIERLFCSPNGHRFIFGCYYARPHETFCDSSRTFYRNELFWTPLFDTLPLDSVVGRCLVLEPQIWAMGRPKSPRYLEDDVFVCEYQIDRNQRSFEKIPPKNRYYINTEPFVFNFFEKKLTMKRDFTPFKITASSTDNKTSCSSTASRTDCCCTTTSPLFNNSLIRQRILQQNLEFVCSKISAQKIAVGIGTSKSSA
ncbi:hypothetical protein niasHS_007202 [Heterodera schachtii]|uniref:BAH domain-containing protein n=1 Tax=Heterodera schachtii TaxID=97005 RepID=A0ABD2JJN7_HETSC